VTVARYLHWRLPGQHRLGDAPLDRERFGIAATLHQPLKRLGRVARTASNLAKARRGPDAADRDAPRVSSRRNRLGWRDGSGPLFNSLGSTCVVRPVRALPEGRRDRLIQPRCGEPATKTRCGLAARIIPIAGLSCSNTARPVCSRRPPQRDCDRRHARKNPPAVRRGRDRTGRVAIFRAQRFAIGADSVSVDTPVHRAS